MNTPISNLLAEKVGTLHTVTTTATVAEAVHIMTENHIGAVLVIEGEKLVGIFTERDVLQRVVAQYKDPRTTTIERVMTPNPVTITGEETVCDVMNLHAEKHFRHLPVVEHGQVVGMLSVRDIIGWLADSNCRKAAKLEEFIESGGCAF